MSRVSQEELYNDKDVVTQILKLKDTVNDYAGGIIENIDVSGNNLVIEWADGTNISLPLPNPTGISSIAGSISGTDLTITIYMTDGSSHAFTTPLNGIATEGYVDAGLLLKADAADVYTKIEVDNIFSTNKNTKISSITTIAELKDAMANAKLGDIITGRGIRIDGTWANCLFQFQLICTIKNASGAVFTASGVYSKSGAAYPSLVNVAYNSSTEKIDATYYTNFAVASTIDLAVEFQASADVLDTIRIQFNTDN